MALCRERMAIWMLDALILLEREADRAVGYVALGRAGAREASVVIWRSAQPRARLCLPSALRRRARAAPSPSHRLSGL